MNRSPIKGDVLIIGAGIIGLGIAVALQECRPNTMIIIAEKKDEVCLHASGRNLRVIHAGFYYSSEFLKSKFCRLGNLELKKFCRDQKLPLKEIGKVVVAKNAGDVKLLEDLAIREEANGVDIELLSEKKLYGYESMTKTYEKFLWSPTTSIANPYEVALAMKSGFLARGGQILFGEKLYEFRENLAVFCQAILLISMSVLIQPGLERSQSHKSAEWAKCLAYYQFLAATFQYQRTTFH